MQRTGLEQIYRSVDEAWAAVVREIKAAGGKVECGPTCTVCCRDKQYFVQLPVSEPEAALIAEALDTLDEENRRVIVGRHLTNYGYCCAFLRPNGCSIYPSRPLRCRIYGLPGSPWECKLNSAPNGLPGIEVWAAAVDDALVGLMELDIGKRISFYEIVEKWRRGNGG